MVDKVLHAQMPFTTGRQTVNDRLTAAYHSVAGSQLGKTVCKATTEEAIGPKKKHLDYLIHCTHEPNVSIPQLANFLVERTTNANWCVVYKSLITIHNLMCYGNERFSQYLASSNANFNLGNFLDKASMQGYDMSTYVRRYAKYITEKIYNYRIMAFDFCKVKRGREDGLLRTMAGEKLLKTLPALQGQVDALLEFQVSSNDLTNGVINSCFILLFRDLIRLFACYNDGVINLLEKYFDMNKKQCREALELYKNFLLRMDKVAEFLKIAESVGIDRGEIPDLAKAPASLLEALEQHVNALEGQKGASSGGRVGLVTSTQTAIQTFSKGYTEPKSGYVDPTTLDENVKRKILEEEEQRLNLLKEQRMRELEFTDRKVSEVKAHSFSDASANKTVERITSSAVSQHSAIDDLLSLDVPVAASGSTNPFLTNHGFYNQQSNFVPTATSFANGQLSTGFANENSFAKAFGTQEPPKNYDRLSDFLTPEQPHVIGFTNESKKVNRDAKLVAGDLDSSLASLAENFSIGKSQESLKSKPVQWGPSKPNYQSLGYGPSGYSSTTSWISGSQQSQMLANQTSGYAPIDTTMLMYGQLFKPRPLNPVYTSSGFGTSYNTGPNMVPNAMADPKKTQYGVKNPFEAL